MKILILAAIVALSGCFGGSGGGTSSSDGPEMFSQPEQMDDIDRFLATLTPRQQEELMYYISDLAAWDATGRNEPEPTPPSWLPENMRDGRLASAHGNAAAASYSAASYEPQNVIRVYSAPPNQYCPPCQRLDAWLGSLTASQKDELSVEFIKAVPPAWVQQYPTLHWKVGDQWWKSEGWEGIDKFALTYNQSIKAGSKKKGSMGSAPALLDVTSLSASSSEQIPASPEQGQETQFQSGTGRASYCRGKRCYR